MGSLKALLLTSREACECLAPMVRAFYASMNSEVSKLKADKSAFTIADGIVQHLLTCHLFCGDKFCAIVGEEDVSVNISSRPYMVDDLTVPDEFTDLIDSTREQVGSLAAGIKSYDTLTIFIDPIDGTREFASGLGEQCSICIGFADTAGKAVAGLVFRPIPPIPTWAAGAASESFAASNLERGGVASPNGLLTTNGSISPFTSALLAQGGMERVRSGGAGNKMLMLLEGRWDGGI